MEQLSVNTGRLAAGVKRDATCTSVGDTNLHGADAIGIGFSGVVNAEVNPVALDSAAPVHGDAVAVSLHVKMGSKGDDPGVYSHNPTPGADSGATNPIAWTAGSAVSEEHIILTGAHGKGPTKAIEAPGDRKGANANGDDMIHRLTRPSAGKHGAVDDAAVESRETNGIFSDAWGPFPWSIPPVAGQQPERGNEMVCHGVCHMLFDNLNLSGARETRNGIGSRAERHSGSGHEGWKSWIARGTFRGRGSLWIGFRTAGDGGINRCAVMEQEPCGNNHEAGGYSGHVAVKRHYFSPWWRETPS